MDQAVITGDFGEAGGESHVDLTKSHAQCGFCSESPVDERSGVTPRASRIEREEPPGLVHFNRACPELKLAVSINEVKHIRDKAEAMRVYAAQVKCSLEMQNLCAEIKLRAERRLGEMLRDSGISEHKSRNLFRGRIMQPRDNTPSLSDLGISKSQSSRW